MTGSSKCADARPVRSPDNSAFKTPLAPCMRRLISLRSCVVAFAMAIPRTPHRVVRRKIVAGLTDDRCAPFTAQHGLYGALLSDREDNDRHPVFSGKREGGTVHDPEILLDGLLVADFFVTLGFRVFFGVSGVNTVDIGGFEHGLRLQLSRPQHGGRIGREIR